jgi:diguanylate cyclase (GGDEF)-like protein
MIMTIKTAQAYELERMHALLGVSRELLQTDEVADVLALAGRAIVELAGAEEALLIVRCDGERVVAFDRRGRPLRADTSHPWYRMAADTLGGDGRQGTLGGHTMALRVPAANAVAALVVGWDDDDTDDRSSEWRRLLVTILGLTVAALGKIRTRSSLEELVATQHEQMADSVRAHASELARRDAIEDEMRVVATTDVLTGLNNRRGFFAEAGQAFRLVRRRHTHSAVIFADIDNLKQVNDSLGHEVGDNLLCDAASVFRESFRGADVVARLGGDEFVAFTLDDAQPNVILSRLQDNLRAFNLMQERPYRVSVSAGIVECDPDGERGLRDYVLLADQQMYLEKRRRLH